MIQFNQTLINVLSQPSIESFYLVKIAAIELSPYLITSYASNITLSNGETYINDGRLVSVTPPKLSTVVDREIYTITLTDSDYFYGQFAETGLVGKKVEVRVGFINQNTGLPLTDISDTLLIYRGQVDSASYSIDTSNVGSVIFTLSCASPMANLDGVKVFYGSKPFMRDLNTEDTSFDQVYEGSGKINLKWGKR